MKNIMITFWVSLLFLCLNANNILNAQCNIAGYSTNEKDSWLSCQTNLNPNNSRGESHWLQYDLGYVYELGTSKFWNYNVSNLTGRGFKDIAIDYSVNGTSWTAAGTFQLPQADGNPDYEGSTGIDLSGISARYILITALSNWNGGICSGISEVRFEVSIPNNACGDYLVTQNIGGNAIDAGVHYSNNMIESNGTIKEGTNVTFKSATAIYLKAGFMTEVGSQFLAKIERCNVLEDSKSIPNEGRGATKIIENSPAINRVKLFPNPTTNLLNINFEGVEVTDLMIINISGHEILRRKNGQNFNQIDVSQLPSGIYLVNLLTADQQLITIRFIKTGL